MSTKPSGDQRRALQKLPSDVVVHPKLVVTRRSGEAILKQLKKGKPSAALRDLMRPSAW